MVLRPPASRPRRSPGDPEAARREALGSLLRSRRERLDPSALGLLTRGRRRTPGLRREEVAARAGVGVVWYTWLEQGRDVRPSREVLAFIADALVLGSAERELLFTLGGHGPPEPSPLASAEQVPRSLRPVLAALGDCPAYVSNVRWDILAWNDAADRAFGLSALPDGERNSLLLMFTRPSTRERMANWDEVAARLVASFRLHAAPYFGEPWFEALLSRLRESEPFERLWGQHEVTASRGGRKLLRLPDRGLVALDHQAFQIIDAPSLRLVVYTPAEPSR